MARSVAAAPSRQEVTSGRAASQLEKLPRRAVSHRARLGATHLEATTEAIDLEVVRLVMERRGISTKAFAIQAGAARTQVSAALAGVPGRNLAYGWVLRQGKEFVADVQAEVDRRMGLSHLAKRQASFDAVVEVLRGVWFRERDGERRPA